MITYYQGEKSRIFWVHHFGTDPITTGGICMSDVIIRKEMDEEWADATIVAAGNFVFIGFCSGNEGQPVEDQMDAAFEILRSRLSREGLGMEAVVQINCLFRNIDDLEKLPDKIRKHFGGRYPARKCIETRFAREEINFQIDAIAYRGNKDTMYVH